MKTRVEIISFFFKSLDSFGKYALLHHAEDVFNSESDIDFVVACNSPTMLSFVKDFVKKTGLLLTNYYTIDSDIYRFDICYFQDGIFNKIELDCSCSCSCSCSGDGNDLLQIDSSKLLADRIEVSIKGNHFYKVSNENEVEYYIKKKAYKKSDVLAHIKYFKLLSPSLSEEEVIIRYNFWRNKFDSKLYKIKYMLNKISLINKRIFEKPALTICFLGPDGSGKSTIIEAIKKYPLFINYSYYHLKPLKNKNSSNDGVMVADPHKFPPYSKLKSYIKLCYFICQYNLGWLKNITPLTIKSSLVIFDRYFDDLLVDNRRYRYGGSLCMAKLARKFIPKPDICFILTADAKVIYERKQEVPFEELERQIKGYKSLDDGKRYFNIDVNRTPEEITKEIVNIMMVKMNERY